MDAQYLIYGLIGIAALYLVIKLLKWPIKILVNGVVGVVMLFITNFILANLGMVGISTNFTIGINPISALIAGFFGVPGVIVLIIINLLA